MRHQYFLWAEVTSNTFLFPGYLISVQTFFLTESGHVPWNRVNKLLSCSLLFHPKISDEHTYHFYIKSPPPGGLRVPPGGFHPSAPTFFVEERLIIERSKVSFLSLVSFRINFLRFIKAHRILRTKGHMNTF